MENFRTRSHVDRTSEVFLFTSHDLSVKTSLLVQSALASNADKTSSFAVHGPSCSALSILQLNRAIFHSLDHGFHPVRDVTSVRKWPLYVGVVFMKIL